jgi:predicted GH43/DUF377 family glycosyl hydrolase
MTIEEDWIVNVFRYPENPILAPKDIPPHRPDFEVIGAFNAGVARYNDEIILLLRVAERPTSHDSSIVHTAIWDVQTQSLRIGDLNRNDERYNFSDPRTISLAGKSGFSYLTSISYLRIARSKDGHRFTVDDQPFMFPQTELETFGIEDPRITQIGDTYYITYSAVSPVGVGVGLASTKDFVHVERHGMILAPENKDVVLFPERIGGKYYALHRPVPHSIGEPEVWIAESDNLLYWGNHRHLFGLRPNSWDSGRLGAGAVPFKTDAGWVELYHAADHNARYCMGAVLLDLNDPTKVIARTDRPVLEPEVDYEVDGFFGNVVFSCGALLEGDTVRVYYGVADTSMACAELSLESIFEALR